MMQKNNILPEKPFFSSKICFILSIILTCYLPYTYSQPSTSRTTVAPITNKTVTTTSAKVNRKETVAILARVIGQVEIQRGGNPRWEKGTVGIFLGEGDSIRTGKTAKAVLLYSHGAETKLNENTELTIGKPEVMEKKIKVKKGQIWSTTGIRAKVTVATPIAVIAVRGTQYDASVDETDGNTEIYVYDGSVSVSNSFGSVEVKPGEKTSVVSGAAPNEPKKVDTTELKQRAVWQQAVKVNKKNLILDLTTETGEKKTLKLQFTK